MCGIYGVYSAQGDVTPEAIIARRDRLAHRGPNDAGLWRSTDGCLGLAHQRLSIVDLSPTGHQPMFSPDERYIIVFNGEIYNYLELRAILETQGISFVGDSDTEVLLASYRVWGVDCVSRLNGMFAFAIYDRGTADNPPRLFFARDRVGKKPFYYVADTGFFEFASEMKALSAVGDLSIQALNYYLALGYVPGNLCIADRVRKLPPAHCGILDLHSGRLEIFSYWALPAMEETPVGDVGPIVDEVERLLTDSIRLRLHADVPVGVLLSGGLDSGLIAALAAKQSSTPIRAFTISFPGTRYDESSYARCVANFLGAEHHVLEVERPSLDILENFKGFIDEPIADSSLIPSYIVSKLTRKHVTVALGGDGGDELFGGYSDYPVSLADQRRLGWMPAWMLKYIALIAASLPAGIKGRNRLASLRGGPLQQMIWGSPYFDIELRRRILNPELVEILGDEIDAPERWLLSLFQTGHDPVDSMTRTHFGSILPDDFLVKVDRASMMNSLEIRCPLLDHRLIEFAFSKIPSQWKVNGHETRRIERILAKRLLPAELNTNRKQGFSIPLDEWLRSDNGGMVKEYAGPLYNLVNEREVNNLINGLMRQRANGSRLYALIALGMAYSNFK